jgi:hypothetical protein
VRAREDDGRVEVAVELAEGMRSDLAEAQRLVAYLADRETGRVLVRGLLTDDGSGRRLVVRLDRPLPLVPAVAGIYEVGVAERIRADPLGRAIARLDRLALLRWSAARRSGPGAHRVLGELTDQWEVAMDVAEDRAAPASVLERLCRAAAAESDGDRVELPTLGEMLATGAWRGRHDDVD